MKKSLPIATSVCQLISYLCVKKVYNKERLPENGKVIMVSNHSSLLDGIVLCGRLNWIRKASTHTIAYKEPFDHWFHGWILRSGKCIPFDRKAPDSIEEMLRTALMYLKNHEPVMLFPEGHLNDGQTLRLPRPGAALLALESGAPLLPLGVRGTREAFPLGGMPKISRQVTIHFGKMVCTRAMSEKYHSSDAAQRVKLVTTLQQIMMEKISDLSGMALHRRMRKKN